MRKLLFALLALTTALSAQNTYQLPLQSGVWHLIGVNGFHHRMPLPQTFESGGAWVQLRETPDADYAFTWDYVDATTKNNHTTPNVGSETYSTLGFRLAPGNDSGVAEVLINFEQVVKDNDQPMLSMFVASQGEGRRADVEIRFQADYKGQGFYIKFDDSLVMEGIFDPRYTSDAPAYVKPRKDASTTVKKIADVFDTNFSDNNLTALELMDLDCETLFCVSEGVAAGGRQKLNDANVTAYHWSPASNNWAIYSSRSDESQNDFNEFTAGKAYWVRIDAPATGDEVGAILGKGDITEETYKTGNFVQNRWNILSFDDSNLRHTPSMVFVTEAEFDAAHLIVRDNFNRDLIELNTSGLGKTALAVARELNLAAYADNESGRTGWKIRAYPANNGTDDGVAIICDEDFEIGMAGLTSAAGSRFLTAPAQPSGATRLTLKSPGWTSICWPSGLTMRFSAPMPPLPSWRRFRWEFPAVAEPKVLRFRALQTLAMCSAQFLRRFQASATAFTAKRSRSTSILITSPKQFWRRRASAFICGMQPIKNCSIITTP